MEIAGLNYHLDSGIATVANNFFEDERISSFDVERSSWPIFSQTHTKICQVPKKVREIEKKGYEKLVLPTHLLMSNLNPDNFEMEIIPLVHDLYKYKNREELSVIGRLSHYFIMRNLKRCNKVIAVSNQTRNDLEEFFDFETIEVISPGIDTDSLYPEHKSPEEIDLPEKYILYIGSLSPRKNTGFLVDVLEFLPEEFHLVIAGQRWDEDRKKDLEDRSRQKGLIERTHIYGFLSMKDLRRTYSNAEVYLHPAKKGGLELTPLEAATCGTPVVLNPEKVPASKQLEDCAEFYYDYDAKTVADIIRGIKNRNMDFEPRTLDQAQQDLVECLLN